MTEPIPDHDHEDEELPDPSLLPRWIPVLIGGILAVMAGLAVWTGLRFRDDETMKAHVRPRPDRRAAAAPPGEPGAGASLVLHGRSGETTPAAGAPVTGRARAEIRGGPQGVEATLRLWARRGMVLDVVPEDAMVYVNDLPIGEVRQFNTPEEVYDFAEPGSYVVRIVAPRGPEKRYVVTATDSAPQDIARISARLVAPGQSGVSSKQ